VVDVASNGDANVVGDVDVNVINDGDTDVTTCDMMLTMTTHVPMPWLVTTHTLFQCVGLLQCTPTLQWTSQHCMAYYDALLKHVDDGYSRKHQHHKNEARRTRKTEEVVLDEGKKRTKEVF
jgi:hypothetical protein